MKLTSLISTATLIVSSCSKVDGYTDTAIFRQNFEETTSDWNFDNLIRVQDYSKDGTTYGSMLRTKYPPNDRGSPRITERFSLDEEVTEATLSYDIKFHSQFLSSRRVANYMDLVEEQALQDVIRLIRMAGLPLDMERYRCTKSLCVSSRSCVTMRRLLLTTEFQL